MECKKEEYAITYFHFDYENTLDGSFLMASKTNMELTGVSSTLVRFRYNWSRKILRTDNNKPVVFQKSRTYLEFGFEISDALINEILDLLKKHEEQNLEFIRTNSFGVFETFPNVFYSSFLDENVIPYEEKKANLTLWLKTKIQDLCSDH
ncbi:hypothetical protein BBI01_01430 [Chryseobacterium artocarpi]|uniref:Uncharacterized protein n=1 Tax=Chryseobacterium artocarpi TaxID=1414727 RepID=A0A1B9A006_9FLAO|nr:hypothetical protein [Chryseobacterium artocarpi]OCA77152.1 hypothetical protein BBI01_01430 [Chryseobacterium artocarpi]